MDKRYIVELANFWSLEGHQVHVVVLRAGESFYKINKEIDVIKLGLSNDGEIKKISSGFRTFFKLRKTIKQIKPDFVLSILSSTNILTILATRYLGVKVFVEDVMSPLRPRSKLEKQCRKLLYKRATGVIALTNFANDIIKKETGQDNIVTIPNPVKKMPIVANKREKIIINVGRLNSTKGQKYFIEACVRIKDPDWKFIILDEGELRFELEQQIDNLNITNYIKLLGAVKNIDEWLTKASIFAFPSIFECFPIALLEGMLWVYLV